jgi:hypothetical protein
MLEEPLLTVRTTRAESGLEALWRAPFDLATRVAVFFGIRALYHTLLISNAVRTAANSFRFARLTVG